MGRIFRKVAVAALALSGCAGNTPDEADFLRSAKNRLCVAQITADQLEVVRLDGRVKRSNLRRPADGNWPLSARVAPDGSFVVGASGTALVAVTLSGTEPWRVEDVSPVGLPAVTADGKRIVFTGAARRLMVYDTTRRELQAFPASGINPVWNSDGSRIAFEDGGGQVSVLDVIGRSTHMAGPGTEPSWAPGGKLAVRASSQRVDLIDLSTNERRPLIEAVTHVSVPVWAPGGELMMFNRRGPRRWWSLAEWTGSEPNQVMVRNVTDGRETSIGEFYKANHGDYSWITNAQVCSL